MKFRFITPEELNKITNPIRGKMKWSGVHHANRFEVFLQKFGYVGKSHGRYLFLRRK